MAVFENFTSDVANDVEGKRCARCKVRKPLGDFYKSSASLDGLNYYCKGCVSIINRERDPLIASRSNYIRRSRRYGFDPHVEKFSLADLEATYGPGCHGCGIDYDGIRLIIHHVKPVSWGGEHTIENVRRLCELCDRSVTASEQKWVREGRRDEESGKVAA